MSQQGQGMELDANAVIQSMMQQVAAQALEIGKRDAMISALNGQIQEQAHQTDELVKHISELQQKINGEDVAEASEGNGQGPVKVKKGKV